MKITDPTRVSLAAVLIGIIFLSTAVLAQTSSFTFQGKLSESGTNANGSYDFQFELFDSLAGSGPIGAPQAKQFVNVIGGIFTVNLDFGAGSFNGSDRFIQISVKPSGSAVPFTPLTPRQPVTSTPYATRSKYAASADYAENSDNLGGRPADQYVQTVDTRLSDARAPTSGSPFYINNQSSQQSSASFNISGNGTAGGTLSANTVNASQFNIGNNRVLSSAGTDNLFVGIVSGPNNTGFGNTLVGRSAGAANTSANFNSFFGNLAGGGTSTGSNNTFIGRNAGAANTIGTNNTIVGSLANVVGNNRSFATAIGAGATVDENNKIVLGRGADSVSVPGDLSVTGSVGVHGVLSLPLDNQGGIPICGISLPNVNFFTISKCSANVQSKTGVRTYLGGLELLNKLRPVIFNWKEGGQTDIGFLAEEIAAAEPLLATFNEKGGVDGIKYAQITTILVNAVKEQQRQIDLLKKIVCKDIPNTEVCK